VTSHAISWLSWRGHIRIWTKYRPANCPREILKSQVDLPPPFGGCVIVDRT
jgi:hypothetical protein